MAGTAKISAPISGRTPWAKPGRYRAAKHYIDQHGDQAALQAAMSDRAAADKFPR
ncbi:MAG: hypothetical protein ACI9MU_004147 [Alphaproteobacteria bacterium]|jgi:hypothetical protein